MAIDYRIEQQERYLFVKASGFAESLEEHMAYAHAAYHAMIKTDLRLILVDEKELEYRLGTYDVFELAQDLVNTFEHSARIAVVLHPDNTRDARFFEDVVSNRGLLLRYFATFEDAESWLIA